MLTTRPDSLTEILLAARAAYRGGDWETSYEAYSRAGGIAPLSVDDLDAMAGAAWRSGRAGEAMRVGELVYVRLARTDPNSAAAKAVELGSAWLSRGETAVGHGWIRRARGLLAGASDSPVLVRLTYLETVVAVLTDDADRVAERSAALREVSARIPDPEAPTAEVLEGIGDERLAALGRALERSHERAAGQAYYRLGEVRRRRGDVDGAMDAYARAHALGVVPQPGEALLRCALGDVDTAWAEILAAIAGAASGDRSALMRGAVEIALARGDSNAAAEYLRELERVGAADIQLRGALLVHQGRHSEALAVLREALRVRPPEHEQAQLYRWTATAYRGLGAEDAAAAAQAAAAGIHPFLGVIGR